MFWRLLGRVLLAARGRLAVALVALTSGGMVVSALLDLQFDAERKLTQEFRRLGANAVVAPARPAGDAGSEAALFEATAVDRLAAAGETRLQGMAPYLYVVARAGEGPSVLVAGTWPDAARALAPWWRMPAGPPLGRDDLARCLAGKNAARLLGLAPGSSITLRQGGRSLVLTVAGILDAGGPEDDRIVTSLAAAQTLAGAPGRLSVVELALKGNAAEVRAALDRLAAALPGLEVRPIRQITEAEGTILERIRVLILAMEALILALTALSVLATMAALAMERRRDVGLMKALGGSTPRVVRLFFAEVALLGGAGGLLGYALGGVLTRYLGRGIFQSAIERRIEVLPLTLALMVGVALLGALPLRLLGRVRPAAILRNP
jgi:putative ABC transport system permease protein